MSISNTVHASMDLLVNDRIELAQRCSCGWHQFSFQKLGVAVCKDYFIFINKGG